MKPGCLCHADSTESFSVINLSSYSLSSAEIDVLSRGLTFCPQENFDLFEVVTDLQLFARRLLLKSLHAKTDTNIDMSEWASFSMKEFKALRDLTLLFQENNTVDLIDQIDLKTLLENAYTNLHRILQQVLKNLRANFLLLA